METEQSTLDKIRTRPRFRMITHLSPEEYEKNLSHYLKKHADEFTGNINKEVATIIVKTNENQYWKPQLALRTELEEENTVIRGIFGPSSAVWTFFMFLYFVWSVLLMVFFTMWFVEKQIKSSEFPWSLSASIITFILILCTYFSARFGQKKAKTEMEKLRKFAEESTLPYETH